MFEEIFLPPAAAKHRNAPLADLRAGYLLQLKAGGAQRSTLLALLRRISGIESDPGR